MDTCKEKDMYALKKFTYILAHRTALLTLDVHTLHKRPVVSSAKRVKSLKVQRLLGPFKAGTIADIRQPLRSRVSN